MLMYVDHTSERAVRFAKYALGARQQGVNEWYIPGGGSITIGLLVVDHERMPLVKRSGSKEVRRLFLCNRRDRLSEFSASLPIGIGRVCVVSQTLVEQGMSSEEKATLIGQLKSDTTVDIPNEHHQRGGGVVYRSLGGNGRIVLMPTDAQKIQTGNAILTSVTGIEGPHVFYGTTDAANVFELFQSLKVGTEFGFPVVFDTYTSAHTVGSYWQRIVEPSIKATIGAKLTCSQIGLAESDKFSVHVNGEVIYRAFMDAGLTMIADMAGKSGSESLSFADWYRRVQLILGEIVLGLTNNTGRTRFFVVETEEVLRRTSLWHSDVGVEASRLERIAERPVMMLHTPDGRSLRTNQVREYSGMKISKLHEIGGWLGGAAVYQSLYGIGEFGGVLVPVKDSEAGNVHLLARPFLEDPFSGLHLTPVGLFRLTVLGQNEDWTIDPWALLEILERWGREKAREEVQKMWDAIEVPLAVENIGKKTVATVTAHGIHIAVS